MAALELFLHGKETLPLYFTSSIVCWRSSTSVSPPPSEQKVWGHLGELELEAAGTPHAPLGVGLHTARHSLGPPFQAGLIGAGLALEVLLKPMLLTELLNCF